MATATATDDVQTLVSKPDTAALFMAIREDLRLVKFPRYPQFGAGGQKVGENFGEVVNFRDGVLRVPAQGTITLEDGREKDAAEVLTWLVGDGEGTQPHKLLGDRHQGFWRVDPTAPPVSKDELKALMRAAATLDTESLERALSDERDGWDRPDMIEAIEENLATVSEILRESQKAAAEAEKAEAKPAKKAE